MLPGFMEVMEAETSLMVWFETSMGLLLSGGSTSSTVPDRLSPCSFFRAKPGTIAVLLLALAMLAAGLSRGPGTRPGPWPGIVSPLAG